ncbi:MAG: peptidoglycan-binding protein, partial [Ilumatobacteraceae bacterium]
MKSKRALRAAAIVTVVTLAPSCLGPLATSVVRAAPPASPAGGCVADAELKLGDVGSSVICVQYALGMIGLSDRPINGVYDDATSALVRWFQSTNPPLRVDGRAGAQTLTALGIWSGRTAGVAEVICKADALIEPDDASPSVRCLQLALLELGLYKGEITGVFDPPTVAALTQFQIDTPRLDIDGRGGPRTLAALGIWSGRTSTFSPSGDVVFATGSGPGSGGVAGNARAERNTPGAVAPPGPWPAAIQLEKQWALTAEGIPFYATSVGCTRSQADSIAYQFAKDGADVSTQQWAVYVASREGGCRYDVINQNAATQDDSHCTFQLNVLAGLFSPAGALGRNGWTAENVRLSLADCADAASDLWVYCGRGPWTPPYSCRPPWKDVATT